MARPTDRLGRLEHVFAGAAELPNEARADYVRRACADDDAMQEEIFALLLALEKAGTFLDTPALDLFAQQISREGWNARPGDSIGSYRVLARTAAGGMGEVWRARDDRIGRDVAIKLLLPHPSNLDARVEAFQREARAAGALNHPNIVTVHDVGEHRGAPYLVTEWLDGESLRARLASGRLPIDAALDIALQLARGLAAAHARGIIHRDLKPENVFLVADGRVKVLDFGLATLHESPVRRTREGPPAAALIGGTIGYMAPEQVSGDAVDHRADLFAFGALLREMLPRESLPSLSSVVERCIAHSPADRFATTDDLLSTLETIARERALPTPSLLGVLRRPASLAWVALLLILAGFAAWRWHLSSSRAAWARTDAAAEISRLTRAGDIASAFVLAREALAIVPDDPHLKQLWLDVTVPWDVTTEPAGADLQIAVYRDPNPAWITIGATPLADVRLPRALIRIRMSKPGFEPVEGSSEPRVLTRRLDPLGSAPEGMVRVRGGRDPVRFGGVGAVDDFWLGRFEVTNREFKEFVDHGGYTNSAYWREPFVERGRHIPWDKGVTRFVDRTGRPGPATWQDGTYRDDQADLPVGGVSWYEAAAYAAFAGKSLPTIYHWFQAADLGRFADILAVSNFGADGPARVGRYGGLGAYGTYDMAGNVKEWCLNESAGRRFLLGGAWNEPRYMFSDYDAKDPFDRQPNYGFRLAQYVQRPGVAATAAVAVQALDRTAPSRTTVSNEIFEIYRRQYAYDRTPLDAVVETTQEIDLGTKQTVSFETTSGERMRAFVILPREAAVPLQAVVFFPGADALRLRSSQDMALAPAYDIVRGGRAFVYPVYRGMYERGVRAPGGPHAERELFIAWSRDLGRTIDYLETRSDIDTKRLAFYGISLGASAGVVLTALERRLAASVLQGAGYYSEAVPEIDPLNFAPRVAVPTLMLNGRYDFENPYEGAQRPLFELLGSAPGHKKHVSIESGHALPSDAVARELLAWLDRYLGPVERQPR